MILASNTGQTFLILGIIVAVVVVIALVAFLIHRFTHPRLKDDKPAEEEIVQEELNRLLKPIDDEEVAHEVEDYKDKKDE